MSVTRVAYRIIIIIIIIIARPTTTGDGRRCGTSSSATWQRRSLPQRPHACLFVAHALRYRACSLARSLIQQLQQQQQHQSHETRIKTWLATVLCAHKLRPGPIHIIANIITNKQQPTLLSSLSHYYHQPIMMTTTTTIIIMTQQ
jgi:hypothetical protein